MISEYGHRIKRAMEYQKKAVMALLPEGMEEHLEVIGGEMRKMMLELTVSAIRDCRESDLCRELFGGRESDLCRELFGGRESVSDKASFESSEKGNKDPERRAGEAKVKKVTIS